MKIKKEHYKELKEIMEYGLTINTRLRMKYRKHGWSDMQYVRDVFDTCVPESLHRALYGYLNDNHVDTVLLKIISKFQ